MTEPAAPLSEDDPIVEFVLDILFEQAKRAVAERAQAEKEQASEDPEATEL